MDLIDRLVDALRCLPGVGPKSAQRMVFHLLKHQRQRGLSLAFCLQEAMERVQHCQRCNNYTEFKLCKLCQHTGRNPQILCIVETPADLSAVEQSQAFNGSYYVLMGKISPLDGLGPEEIGLPRLRTLVIEEQIKEVILALSPTIEGQTTAHFIYELLCDQSLRISQLAHGIPSGGELEFLNASTIGNALRNRASLQSETTSS